MLKRIVAIAARDLKSGMRDFMVVYIIIAPILLAYVLSLFVPSAGAATLQFAVDKKLGNDIVDYLSQLGNVEVMKDADSIKNRVMQSDDVVGITKDGTKYEIILEGNETENTDIVTKQILMHFEGAGSELPVEIKFSDIGWRISPLAQYGAITLVIMTTVLGGMMISFGIVEEKQSGTIGAVYASPVGRIEFVTGKSILGFIIPIAQSIAVMMIFRFTDVNFAMLLLVILCSSLIGILIGFVIGVIANDQISAVSSMKMTFLPAAASVIGAILLPSRWLPVLYWSPFYWTFAAINDLILKRETWANTLTYCGAILLLTPFAFLLFKKRIKTGLA